MRRILVTGGTGFIGRGLSERLAAQEGVELRLLTRSASLDRLAAPLRARAVAGDLADATGLEAALEGVDVVYHLAGATRAWTRAGFDAVNVAGTRVLAEAFARRARPGARFLHVSSLAAVGPARGEEPLAEGAEPAPVSAYGASKLAGERIVRALLPPSSWTIVRPPAVYGPGERDLLAMFRMARRGRALLGGPGEQSLSLVYVGDLIEALVRLADVPRAAGEALFVAHPEIVTDRAFVAAMGRAFGKTPQVLRVPAPLIGLLGGAAGLLRPFAARPPLLNPDRAREMRPRRWICSPRRFEALTGWSCPTQMDEGVRLTADWQVASGLHPGYSAGRGAPPR